MESYDKQYSDEVDLFGLPYVEFGAFLQEHVANNGRALDLGCGQGRDTLLLARHGLDVVGVDSSSVGIEQVKSQAQAGGLSVTGVVADIYAYPIEPDYDLIVLDSMLHFGKAERQQELALLDKAVTGLKASGYLVLFVHKSDKKEKELRDWRAARSEELTIIEQRYLDYTYHEKSTDFRSEIQYFMWVLQLG